MNVILNSKACSGISPLRPGPGIGLLYSWLMGGGPPCPVFLEAVLATLPPELNLVAIIGLKWPNSRCPTRRDYRGLAVFSVNGLHVERTSFSGNLESGQFQYRQSQNQHAKSPKAQLASPQVSEDRACKTLFVKTELLSSLHGCTSSPPSLFPPFSLSLLQISPTSLFSWLFTSDSSPDPAKGHSYLSLVYSSPQCLAIPWFRLPLLECSPRWPLDHSLQPFFSH